MWPLDRAEQEQGSCTARWVWLRVWPLDRAEQEQGRTLLWAGDILQGGCGGGVALPGGSSTHSLWCDPNRQGWCGLGVALIAKVGVASF